MTIQTQLVGLFTSFLAIFSYNDGVNNAVSQEVYKQQWVDSVYNSLDQEERIGQLFMVAAYSGGSNANESSIKKLVAANQVGGLIFMQGTPEAQARQNNEYQQMSKVPLLIGMDAEWGLGMRLTGVQDLPRQMMIGASNDTALAYKVGAAIAYQCKRLGVHINFGPVVDVNNNPRNPIINARSYGEDKYKVAKMGIAYMKGLQDFGIMACAKHFPGHGDTDADSHKDLPTINKSMAQLEDIELFPFRQLINKGVQSIMVAHLNVPALEQKPNTPTTLSSATITDLLKNKLHFNGLIFTDALNMQGVAKYYQPGDVDLKAFVAGNDVLLFSQDVPTAINKIKAAMASGQITEARLAYSVKKILAAKYDVGLNHWKPVTVINATEDLNRYTDALATLVANASFTRVRDRNKLLPSIPAKANRIAYVGVNAGSATDLYNALKANKPELKAYYLPKGSGSSAVSKVMQAIDYNDIIIVAVHNMSFYPTSGNDYGLDAGQMSFLKKIQKNKKVVLVLMGNPYLLQHFCDFGSILVGYEDTKQTEAAAASVLLNDRPPFGTLPVSPCLTITADDLDDQADKQGSNIKVITDPQKKTELVKAGSLQKVFFVEDAGVKDPGVLDEMSLFIQRAVVDGAFPGCQVLAAKDGKIFFNRGYGYMDYTKKKRVDTNTIYDVASLTKVLSTTLAVMQLYEDGKLNLNKTLGDYLPWVVGTDKANLKIRDLLLHQAGLKSWIPFYKETLDSNGNGLNKYIYHTEPDNDHRLIVAKGIFIRNDYVDTIWKRILESPLENKGRYVYSDLDYLFLAEVVKTLTGQPLDKYVENTFYKPMGLEHIAYNPLRHFNIDDIAPTEYDAIFRGQTVHGFVHDPGAAMMGGVAGHAGIFANAEDVAAVFQLLMGGGVYNGKRFFKKSTIDYFTRYNSRLSRRGLGFDKPSDDERDGGPCGDRVSGFTFGHQGFTGTCAWADPETGVVFVFLSNRVNPSADNWKINSMSIRTKVQDYFYRSLGYPVNKNRAALKRAQVH